MSSAKPLDKIEVGIVVNSLTVLSPAEPGKNGSPMWNVRCKCGQELIASDNALRKHEILECGLHDRKEDLTGQRFGILTVLRRDINTPFGKPQFYCRCDCGNERTFKAVYLKKFHEPNCGCLTHDQISKARTSHGLESHPLYPVWRAMISRCENPNNKDYKHYGGRGITVCERWHDVTNFVADMEPGYEPGLQLDRQDNEKGYSPENCRWVTVTQNQRNKRNNRVITTAVGTASLAEQAEVSRVSYAKIARRLDMGMPEELSIVPMTGTKKLHVDELKQMFDGDEAVWLEGETGEEISDVIETAEIQAKTIRVWGVGPDEVILGKD